MVETVIIVRINGNMFWPFRIVAADREACKVAARIHVEAVTGIRPLV